MNFLKGKKTMIGSAACGLIMVVWSFQLIDDEVAKALLGVAATFTGVSMRLAIRDGK